jgi:hypothetical protein
MKTKEAIKILNNLMVSNKLSADERNAVSEACGYMSQLEYKRGELTDFQGWPLDKLNMKYLRKFVRDNDALDDDVKLLILEDDGMGYGARNGYCTNIFVSDGDDNKKEVQFWF